MSQIETQTKDIERLKRLVNDEKETLLILSRKRDELDELIKLQRDNIRNKEEQLTKAINRLEAIKAGNGDIESKEYTFICEKCGKTHEESFYCIAQRALGHTMTHTCDCGHKTYLEPYKK